VSEPVTNLRIRLSGRRPRSSFVAEEHGEPDADAANWWAEEEHRREHLGQYTGIRDDLDSLGFVVRWQATGEPVT
jgi:hypothetical protein